jgi:hypothetical protein
MAITSTRTTQLGFSGDITQNIIQSALANVASPGQTDKVSLAIGFNAITPPSNTGDVITCLTIIPPAGNVNLITLKGVTGDTGIPLHKTDHTQIALDSTFTTLGLTVTVAVIGVRLVWS